MRKEYLARALLVLAAPLAAGALVPIAAQPLKVGELELVRIETPHPYLRGAGPEALELVVRYPGATYIRIHFENFDLAPGDFVQIFDPAGRRVHVYRERGPFGTGEFWAFSVPGDTAVVRLEAHTGGGYGFFIDRYGRGIVPIFDPTPGPNPQPESVCGLQDWQDVKCYETSYPIEFERARGAVKALIGCCSACTGFKVSDSGQYMTNNHCVSSQSGVQSTELLMESQRPLCNSGSESDIGSVTGRDLLRTDFTLDYTLFTTLGDSSPIPCLQIDPRLPPAGERIYIAGHPSAGPKKLSIESTHPENPTGLCEVDASPYPGRDPTSDVGYYCDTTNGSSGSPVLSGDTHKVVAIHHFGGCLNSGARMDRIFQQISDVLDACTAGEPPVCGNGVREPGEECDGADLGGRTCQTQGFDGGTLACNPDCTLDTSGCCTGKGKKCSGGGGGSGTSEQCKNGADDDGDGLVDCADPDCATKAFCR